jgi:hypothetical protein
MSETGSSENVSSKTGSSENVSSETGSSETGSSETGSSETGTSKNLSENINNSNYKDIIYNGIINFYTEGWKWFNFDNYDFFNIPIIIPKDKSKYTLYASITFFFYFIIYWIPSRIIVIAILLIPAIPSVLYTSIYNHPESALYILLGLIIFIGTIIQLVYYVPSPHPRHNNNKQPSTSCPTQTNPLLSMSMPTTASNTAPRSINNLSMNVGQQQESPPQYTSDMISELITETVGLNETYEKMYDSRNIDMRKSFYETISIQILEKWRNVLFIVYFLALLFYSFIIFASGNLTIFEKIKKIIIALIVTNIYFIKFVIITVYWLYNYVSGGTLFG